MKTNGMRIHKHGGSGELQWEAFDLPAVGPGQVLLRQTRWD